MNASAQRAHPEYELSTVMTTGMSAPPIDAVKCKPKTEDIMTATPRLVTLTISELISILFASEGFKNNTIPIAQIPTMPISSADLCLVMTELWATEKLEKWNKTCTFWG